MAHLIDKLCKGGDHDLIAVFDSQSWDYSQFVVRWCQNCGCVVVDIDMDGRTMPGGEMKMQAPKILREIENDYRARKNNPDV